MHAFILGLVGFAMASTLGYNTGPQTNPAKDLTSRLVPWWVGGLAMDHRCGHEGVGRSLGCVGLWWFVCSIDV
jgi:glycerol uptake facilitator-like aquaporin